MWTPADRALVGDFGSGQALTDDQFRLLEPLIPPAKTGGRPRTTDMRMLLDGLFYLVRTGCQWRHLPPPPAFPPWRTVHGYMRAFGRGGVGGHPPPPRGDTARAGRQGAEPERRHRRHPERRDDRKGGPAAEPALRPAEGWTGGMPPRGSGAGSGTSRSTPAACCSAWSSTPPTSRTRTALATCRGG